jgi:hypothetical protein
MRVFSQTIRADGFQDGIRNMIPAPGHGYPDGMGATEEPVNMLVKLEDTPAIDPQPLINAISTLKAGIPDGYLRFTTPHQLTVQVDKQLIHDYAPMLF